MRGPESPDLAWLAARPGTKVLLKGNHEHWWGATAILGLLVVGHGSILGMGSGWETHARLRTL